VRNPLLLVLCLRLAQVSTAQAESPGDFAASMGLTSADGTVRTSASVRVALAPASGVGDFAARMRDPVQTQMGPIRQCFAEAMVRTAGVEGRAMFELEALPHGRARAATAKDETGDPQMVECMRTALTAVPLEGLPVGARSLVSLMLANPAAKVRAGMERRAQAASAVTMLEGGRAETHGATQQGEVEFAVRGSAYLASTLSEFHQDVSGRLAGLLDCRRKASHRNRPAEGTITFDVQMRDGKIARVSTKENGITDRSAPQCVSKWLSKSDVHSAESSANVELAVTFSR
jgi:hypothetical protein